MRRFAFFLPVLGLCISAGCQLVSGLDSLEAIDAAGGGKGAGGTGNNSGSAVSSGTGVSSSSGAGGFAPGMLPAPSACVDGDSNVLLCMSFDGSKALDESKLAQAVNATGVTFQQGPFGMAAVFTQGWNLTLPTAAWTMNAFTIEAWVYLNDVPGSVSGRVILVSPGQFGLAVNNTNHLHCFAFGQGDAMPREIVSTAVLPSAEWMHLSCSFDGSKFELGLNLKFFEDKTLGAPLELVPPSVPVMIGEHPNKPVDSSLQGRLDHIRVHSVAYSLPELCNLFGGCL